jgi:hypothetical protein
MSMFRYFILTIAINKPMKQLMIIAISLLTLAACTKKSSSTSSTSSSDTTFNGSYFQITYNSRSYNVKNAVVNSITYASVTSTVPVAGQLLVTIVTLGGAYGLASSHVNLLGTGTGTYQFSTSILSGTLINQYSPSVVSYTDTSGTANVTHNGSDYTEGTFITTLNGSGFSYPATGSFKIYH